VANPRRSGVAARQVRTLLEGGAVGGLSDRELLERFVGRRGEVGDLAFTALVERHGPMVLRACRATLGDPHDAQDAFQSTFLLLARRADSLWVRDSLGPWLHSVACRVSAGARTAEARRRALEERSVRRSPSRAVEPPRDDLGPALHEEVERLPERLRAPVVLCYLEGLTHEQAAEHLACPVGTVRSRLARGRERLRRGLARRGLAPTETTGSSSPTPATVPASLAVATIHAASRLAFERSAVGPVAWWLASLIEGVLLPMTLHPLKTAAVLLLSAGAIAIGLGVTVGQEPTRKPTTADVAERRVTERRFEATEARFEAMAAESRYLRLRVEDLERKLAAIEGLKTATRPVGLDPDSITKIRPRFNDTLIERVFVKIGQPVKKGDPLFELRSPDLASARNDCRTRFIQWDHDHKFLLAREPLAKEGRVTQLVWTDTVNDEKKSRLDYLVARDRLATYGMSAEQIDELLEGLSDDRGARADQAKVGDLSAMTFVSPVDGLILERDVIPGNFYDRKDVLLVIAPPRP
jgi:RNA polymerase sigma factor (sigma-70 family)